MISRLSSVDCRCVCGLLLLLLLKGKCIKKKEGKDTKVLGPKRRQPTAQNLEEQKKKKK